MILNESNCSIHQLVIPSVTSGGTCLINPSILIDNDNIIVNLRHIQYTYPNEHESQFGPLIHVNPENDIPLTTVNYICKLNNDNFVINEYHKVNTSRFGKNFFYRFVGLADARLIKWHDKFYLCGVRVDTNIRGYGRVEMSEIKILDSGVEEVSRLRFQSPGENDTYQEKNWMPILDKPFHFIRWANPTEVVKVDVNNFSSEIVFHGNHIQLPAELRGGTQLLSWDEGYLTVTHEINMDNARRKYRHRFVYWDKDFTNIKYSKMFSFTNADIEFACGMTEYHNNLLITFGVQDKSAFIINVPKSLVNKMINP